MEIQLVLFNKLKISNIIATFYTDNYREFKRVYPNERYTLAQLRTKLVIKLDGTIVGTIMDALHESQHHNDNMQTKPYNESIIVKESQLRRIIQESINKGNYILVGSK